LISGSKVLEETSFSDHRNIKFESFFHHLQKATVYRKPRNTNWAKLKTIATEKIAEPGIIESATDIKESIKALSKHLTDAFHTTCSLIRTKGTTRLRWWSNDLI